MIDGFSLLIPTQNQLRWLQWCIAGLNKNSRLKNEIIVCDDGSTDGTRDYLTNLEQANVSLIFREPRGCFSGWNECTKISTKEWLMAWQDDMYALPNWDVKLAAWIQEDPTKQWGIQIIEPWPGSYLVHNCGTTVGTFNEQKAVEYMQSVSSHTFKHQVFAHSAISRKDWFDVGGLDERFDPTISGWPDFQEALHQQRPREWNIVNDSFQYHSRHGHQESWRVEPHHQHNIDLFFKKWGVHVGPEHEERMSHL